MKRGEDVLDGQDMVLPVRRLTDDGLKAVQEVLLHGYEGLGAKAPSSRYVDLEPRECAPAGTT
jgi:hypothetical protein